MRIGFRVLTWADLPLVQRWQSAEQAQPWFGPPRSLPEIEATFGPRLRGGSPVRMLVAQLGEGTGWRDVGYLQAYRVGDVADAVERVAGAGAVGIDYVIAPAESGRGVGTAVVTTFVDEIVPVLFPGASRVVAAPHHRNLASLRLLEKAGFTQGWWVDVPGTGDEPVQTVVVCERRTSRS